jgi:hypothetical protein
VTFEDVGKKILQYAPTAASLAGPFLGPVGPLLPIAVKALSSILGVTDPAPTPDQLHAALETAVTSDPNFVAKLSQAQADFQMEQMRLEFADLANARDRQLQHEKVTGKSDYNLYVLAWMFVGGFFATLIVMTIFIFTGVFPKDISPAALYLLGNLNGTLTAGVGAVVQYFFGKNKDSALHNQQLADSIPFSQLDKLKGALGQAGGKT